MVNSFIAVTDIDEAGLYVMVAVAFTESVLASVLFS